LPLSLLVSILSLHSRCTVFVLYGLCILGFLSFFLNHTASLLKLQHLFPFLITDYYVRLTVRERSVRVHLFSPQYSYLHHLLLLLSVQGHTCVRCLILLLFPYIR
jgi:hypothetical protein